MRRYDIAIIGGGISGLGLALLAGQFGLDAVLLERDKVACSTSSNSLRIIHGGFRYLQSLNFKRVLESIKAQKIFLDEFRDFVEPLPCLLPLNRSGFQSKFPAFLAGLFYDFLANRDVKLKSRILSNVEIDKRISHRFSHGALKWWDLHITDQPGLFQSLKDKILSFGTEIRENSKVSHVSSHSDYCRVLLDSHESIDADVVLDTSGPSAIEISPAGICPDSFDWCSAWNILIKTPICPDHAVALKPTTRAFFFTPRGETGAVGTWYSWKTKDLSDNDCIELSVRELHEELPELSIDHASVIGIERGLLPATRSHSSEPTPISNRRIIRAGRYIRIIPAKLTTFYPQAEEILHSIAPLLHRR